MVVVVLLVRDFCGCGLFPITAVAVHVAERVVMLSTFIESFIAVAQ